MKHRYLVLTVVALALVFLHVGTLWASGKKEAGTTATAVAPAGKEAPMLAEKVKDGTLPPLSERLPEQPLVVTPIEEIGQYGGTIRMGRTSPGAYQDASWFYMIGEGLLRIGPDASTINTNVAREYNFARDGKSITLYLRKGMKWSDGDPFDVDDILFWWEDVRLYKDITAVAPKQWSPSGEPMKVEKIDDYTVKFDFGITYPLSLKRLAHYDGLDPGFWPEHFLKQYHAKYNDVAKLNAQAKEKGYDSWDRYFLERARQNGGTPMNIDRPTIGMYTLISPGAKIYKFERNPYFWKVDTAGNQLPYIDYVSLTLVSNVELLNAQIAAGQFDLAGHQTRIINYPLYMENREKGDYRVLIWKSVYGGDVYYQPNQNIGDPVLRKIFQDARFRRALSLAMDRDEINEIVYFGKAEPRQQSMVPSSKLYVEAHARAYAQFDQGEANRLLDEMGLKWDRNHEFRLRPDGKKLSWTLEYAERVTPKTAVSELVAKHWRAVGIDMKLKLITNELHQTRYPGNMVEMGLWNSSGCTDMMFLLWAKWYAPVQPGWETTAWPLWAQWYNTNGQGGEAPPPHIKELMDLYDEMTVTTDESRYIELGKELLSRQAENVWTIGTVGLAPTPIIVNNKLRNFPEEAMWGWDTIWVYPFHTGQFFFKK